LWNTIIAVITPYMTDSDKGNLRSSVFFVWGGLCTAAFVYAYFLVPEVSLNGIFDILSCRTLGTDPVCFSDRQTKGLTLERELSCFKALGVFSKLTPSFCDL
jgi:hypothetical protein